jgi:hypothetical protein
MRRVTVARLNAPNHRAEGYASDENESSRQLMNSVNASRRIRPKLGPRRPWKRSRGVLNQLNERSRSRGFDVARRDEERIDAYLQANMSDTSRPFLPTVIFVHVDLLDLRDDSLDLVRPNGPATSRVRFEAGEIQRMPGQL